MKNSKNKITKVLLKNEYNSIKFSFDITINWLIIIKHLTSLKVFNLFDPL